MFPSLFQESARVCGKYVSRYQRPWGRANRRLWIVGTTPRVTRCTPSSGTREVESFIATPRTRVRQSRLSLSETWRWRWVSSGPGSSLLPSPFSTLTNELPTFRCPAGHRGNLEILSCPGGTKRRKKSDVKKGEKERRGERGQKRGFIAVEKLRMEHDNTERAGTYSTCLLYSEPRSTYRSIEVFEFELSPYERTE